MVTGVACAGLSNVFGIRPVTCAGALFSSFAFGISSIMPRYEILYFTYGILGGKTERLRPFQIGKWANNNLK